MSRAAENAVVGDRKPAKTGPEVTSVNNTIFS